MTDETTAIRAFFADQPAPSSQIRDRVLRRVEAEWVASRPAPTARLRVGPSVATRARRPHRPSRLIIAAACVGVAVLAGGAGLAAATGVFSAGGNRNTAVPAGLLPSEPVPLLSQGQASRYGVLAWSPAGTRDGGKTVLVSLPPCDEIAGAVVTETAATVQIVIHGTTRDSCTLSGTRPVYIHSIALTTTLGERRLVGATPSHR